MNYAEDRLDRRARFLDLLAKQPKQDQSDLHNLADNSNHERCNGIHVPSNSTSNPSLNQNAIVLDLQHAHTLFHRAAVLCEGDCSSIIMKEVVQFLKEGHELAGRSLRDCGLCRQASFHYAMAWMCDVSDAQSAGDYAQMAEFCGYPEIGVLVLLFYRSGGLLSTDTPIHMIRSTLRIRHPRSTFDAEDKDAMIVELFANMDSCRSSSTTHKHCGCMMMDCGMSEFYKPFDMTISETYEAICRSLTSLDSFLVIDKIHCMAAAPATSILDAIAKWERNEQNNTSGSECGYNSDYLIPREDFLLQSQFRTMRFWEMVKDENSVIRNLSPLLQILLLKLLYISPFGGAFLFLACRAVPHMSLSIYLSPLVSRKMVECYKSHWAYFCLIRCIVLGERMKSHRKKRTHYHVPLWDIVHMIDIRYRDCFMDDFISHPSKNILSQADHAPLQSLRAKNQITLPSTLQQKLPTQLLVSPCLQCFQPLFALGDSHVISIGWQTLRVSQDPNVFRTIVPYPVTGLKAWHVKDGTRFFTNYNLHKSLQRLPSSCRSIILSAGEIDCREGIGGERLEGYGNTCEEEVRNTVKEYINAVNIISKLYDLQILVMPVAPHAARSQKNGRKLGRAIRRERMKLWNEILREECNKNGSFASIYLLDYEEDLRCPDKTSTVGFVLNPTFNADYTHMNSAFLPSLERAITRSGCDINLL